ncbi:ABC-type transporter, integral membrane subunit [Spirochaeta thermophila DSM 6578]|uniref:ABC-type transporter, integral membrane subunit n=1 Tax=Winmispira thermophila (strain ATCC 700085 / DSM 6578 / Z-1203) TaxID=869211 RepID=G0GB48_WINT7|nr:ABC transporter permease subunit [Spirochaeta thermophila]AEJ61072.1 ABC-type transporter, integral membrane subunit [Spirochaeta thermophila DSM 6578]
MSTRGWGREPGLVLVVLGALLLWKVVSLLAGSPLIVPSPEEVVLKVVGILRDPLFLSHVAVTTLRALGGFACALTVGVALGVLGGVSGGLILPLRAAAVVLQSVPVVSVILILLIWVGSALTPFWVGLAMAFPIILITTLEGMEAAPVDLLEMARAFGLSPRVQITRIYIPSLIPFVLAGARSALSLVWKAVIAAEVIAFPSSGVGTALYTAKLFIDTPGVFAWTLIGVVLSGLSHLLLGLVSRRVFWGGMR